MTLDDGRIVVFAVTKVTPGDPAQAPEAQRQGFAEQMAQMAGTEDVEGLVKALRSRARIEVAEDRL